MNLINNQAADIVRESPFLASCRVQPGATPVTPHGNYGLLRHCYPLIW